MSSKKEIKHTIYEREFEKIIKEIIKNQTVLQMKNYRQHGDTSCFEHCYNVAYRCYYICKELGWDYKSVTRAAMLHDLFLYDWRIKSKKSKWHAFRHAKLACDNASKIFDLSKKEKDIILKHMWPITVIIPKSKEGFVLTLVDKYCAFDETVRYMVANTIKHIMQVFPM